MKVYIQIISWLKSNSFYTIKEYIAWKNTIWEVDGLSKVIIYLKINNPNSIALIHINEVSIWSEINVLHKDKIKMEKM